MKSTKVQTLGAVALHAITDCTDDASIVGLEQLGYSLVSCLVLHVVGYVFLHKELDSSWILHNGACKEVWQARI